MTEIEYCECCKAKIIKYWHNLNKSLASAMIRMYSAKGLDYTKISELKLSHAQICNFQKLKYWGFVMKGGVEGTWKLNRIAEEFIQGKTSVPKRMKTYRGKVIDEDGQQVLIKDIIEGYQWRKDYLGASE